MTVKFSSISIPKANSKTKINYFEKYPIPELHDFQNLKNTTFLNGLFSKLRKSTYRDLISLLVNSQRNIFQPNIKSSLKKN